MLPLLQRFLLFLDTSAARYYAVLALAGAATLALALAATNPRRRRWTAVPFWLAVALTLLAGRWPGLGLPVAYNADEDQFLAQAITAARRPLPWESFDGQTSGPLNTLALVPPAWLFGAPLNYATARLVGLGTILLGLWALHALLRRSFGKKPPPWTAHVGVLPLLGFYALTDFNDFMHYTSEHVPVALEMLAFSLAGALGFVPARRVGRTAWWAGFILGTIPFAKLQAVPAALATAAVGYGFLSLRRADLGTRGGRRARWALTLGGLAFPLGLGAFLAVRGVFGDFVRSYLEMQLVYLNLPDPKALAGLWERVPDFWAWFWPTLGWSLAGAATLPFVMARRGRWLPPAPGRHGREIAAVDVGKKPVWFLVAGAAAVLAASFYEVYQPHRPYGHYLLFAVFPAGTLAAVVFGALVTRASGEKPGSSLRMLPPAKGRRLGAQLPPRLIAATFLLVGLMPMVGRRARDGHLWRGRLPEFLVFQPPEVIGRLRARLPAPDEQATTMAVWGWRPELFVRTGIAMGTRDAHAQHQIEPGPMQGYYRARFLADMERNRPALFVDAVAPGALAFSDRATQGFESDSALATHVAARYTLVEEVAGVRIFARRPDDVSAAPASPSGGG